jgi:hypothetical protein
MDGWMDGGREGVRERWMDGWREGVALCLERLELAQHELDLADVGLHCQKPRNLAVHAQIHDDRLPASHP